LDAAQNTKVLGILANVAGAQSLTNSQIAKNLKLTEEQKTKLAAIAPAGRGGGGGRGGMTPEEQAARDKEYTDVLTSDQAAAFAKLKEAQAVSEELATELRPRGRGGRGGAGGGRGGAGGPGGGGGFGGRGQQ
jgi:Spy/CpxP family protein refolding chaperone